MKINLASGITCLGKKLQMPALAAFTLFISQQLPAQANHQLRIHDSHRGGAHNMPGQALHTNHAAASKSLGSDFKLHGLSQHHRGFERGVGSNTIRQNAVGQIISLNSGVDLDLGSDLENITLGAKLFGNQNSVIITVGGAEKTLQAGSKVTAAEYLAAKQALSGAAQTLVIGSDGRAAGGSVDFGAIVEGDEKMRASLLINPEGVTVAGDFGRHSDFQLRGDLTNYGSLYAYSSRNGVKSGTIRAHDINNEEGATISTLLPDNLRNDLHESRTPVDLRLQADNDLNNYGKIEGGGSISLSAGHSINNASQQSTITARTDVSLDAPNIVNRGLISSEHGNLNIDSNTLSTLNVDNRLGLLRADNGAINVRSDSYDQNYDTNLYGGNLVSTAVNLNSGQGLMTVDVGQITGTVSQKGTAVHLVAATDDLVLGKACLTGDPTYYNTAGSININGDISVNQALTIVASSNIFINGGFDLIAGDSTQGFPITLIAGANITATAGGADQANLGPIPPANANNGGVTINGGTAGGGVISFTADGSVVSSRAQLPAANTNGGDVLMVAFGGTNAGTGRVFVVAGIQTVQTGGTGVGNNGTINIIGPGDNGNYSLPQMITTGGSGFGGSITVTAADPVANNVVYLANGSLQLGGPTIVPSAALKPNGQIQFNGSLNDAGNSFIEARADKLVQLDLGRDMFARRVTMVCPNGKVGIFGTVTTSDLFSADADSIRTDNIGIQLGVVRSPNLLLTDKTGSIGTSSLLGFNIDSAGNLTSNVTVIGHNNVFISNVNSLTVNTSLADGIGTFSVNGGTSTTVSGDITLSDGNLSLQSTGVIAIGAGTLSTANGSVSVTGSVFGGVTIGNGTLSATNGDVSVLSSSQAMTIGAATLSATTGNVIVQTGGQDMTIDAATMSTTNGNVSLLSNGGAIAIGAATLSSGNGNVSLQSGGGAIAIGAATLSTASGNVSVQSGGGAIAIGAAIGTATLSSGNGNIDIINSGTNKKLSTIKLTNTIISTLGLGDVTISVGTAGAPVLGKAPKKNLTITPPVGGQIFFGKKGITTNAPNNTLTVSNADIIFNNFLNKKNIVLSGTSITAD